MTMHNQFLKSLRWPVLIFASFLWISCSSNTATLTSAQRNHAPPLEELYTTADRDEIIAAARNIIESDPAAALVTVDSEGRPRVRSVSTSKPDSGMSIWIATRPITRKVEQISGNPRVSLYYSDDGSGSYVSIMGMAVLHRDLATIQSNNPFNEEWTARFFPNYPDDILLIEIRPAWMEVMGQGIAASEDTWRPQAVTF